MGQLIREDNELFGLTAVYEYDNAGNRTTSSWCSLKAEGETPTTHLTNVVYTYSSSAWGDILVSTNNINITYDSIGNPITYFNGTMYSFTWTGRKLTGATTTGKTMSFTYNDEGLRTSKTVNGVTTKYIYNGTTLISEQTPTYTIVYVYDSTGLPIGFQYCGTAAGSTWEAYWYEKNLQGDVVAVYDENGVKLISYIYDAFGYATLTYHNGGSSTNAAKNHITYRSYFYDMDLNLYYLQSRYYDANFGRFINADKHINANGDILGFNMFAYCNNNPVMNVDPTGEAFWVPILIGAAIGIAIGFGAATYSDYEDDGEVFNGSVSVGEYVASTLVGGTVGAVAGYAAPTIGSFMSASFSVALPVVAGETVAITVSGAQIVGGALATGALMMFASDNRPGNNKKQNEQFKAAMRELNITDKAKMRRVHDQIKGKNLGYKQLVEFIKEVLQIY